MTKSYRLETATKLTQVNELSDTVHPQVFHVTRCSSCHGQLDLPSSHFMCKHSYHQRYVGDPPFTLQRCIVSSGFIDALPIMRRNVPCVLLHTVFYGQIAPITRSFLINMTFLYRMFRKKGSRQLLLGLVGVCQPLSWKRPPRRVYIVTSCTATYIIPFFFPALRQ